MANMELIGGPTGGQISSPTSSITFSNIPQTYTDLVLKVSARTDFASTSSLLFRPNGSTSNLIAKRIYATGTSALSDTGINALQNGTDTTANTFTNIEVYFPNYTSSNYKYFNLDGVMENNATFGYTYLMSFLWSDNTAISSLTLAADGNFLSGSTFYLYGISNVTSGSKATGGIVSSDGTYWYHMFPFSGTFTPTEAITADYLIVAGGGGAAYYAGGGGGAGGYRHTTGASLTATQYSVTIGAGGASTANVGATNNNGASGSDTVFNSTTSAGGGGAGGGPNARNGISGGSGGGGAGYGSSGTGGSGNTPSTNPSQGNNGANGSAPSGGGGGGAGAAGSSVNGGNGLNTLSSWFNATQTGVGGYIAGGGGAYGYGIPHGIGGLGGGGNYGDVGAKNTGGGAGGDSGAYGGSNPTGGSGLVIIRYAI